MILLACVVVIAANEIVIRTILMLTVHTLRLSGVGAGDGVMLELDDDGAVTRSARWTILDTLMPIGHRSRPARRAWRPSRPPRS